MESGELVKNLRTLADRLEKTQLGKVLVTSVFVWSKAEAQEVIRAIGGKWTKEVSGNHEGATMSLISQDTGVVVYIPRDKICRKTVTWDCEPLLSPEEEATILEPEEVAA